MIDPSIYSFDIPLLAWLMLGGMLMCMMLIAIVMWPRLARVARRVKRDDRRVDEAVEAWNEGRMKPYPPMSVVVYSNADGDNLRTLLPQILNQDYPAPFEVIVVNDVSGDDTETIVSEMSLEYPNLYMTFAPENSRSLSRRKLAITLAIKAARYDALLLTCGNCRIESPLWARAMMRHIISGKREVVIGYAEPWGDGEEDTDRRRRRRDFDFAWHSIRYLNAAMRHDPLMGTGYNLCYTRRLFFEHKGFSRTLNLTYGDDDVFISEIANGDNTAVELSHAGRVKSVEHSPADLHDAYRQRRNFTAQFLRRGPYMSMGFTSLLWWLWPVFGGLAVWFALPSLVGAAAVFLSAMIFILVNAALWCRCMRSLSLKPLFMSVAWMSWTRPLRTMRHALRLRSSRKINLTQTV